MSPAPAVPAWNPHLVDLNRGSDIVVMTSIFTVLITLSTGTRIITKVWVKARLRAEDYLIICGYIFNISCNILEYLCVAAGFDRHKQFLTVEEQLRFKKWGHFAILLATLALWAVKISICFFLLSLIRSVHNRARMLIWALISITTAASAAQILFWATQARPLKKLWEPDVPGTYASKRLLVISIITFTAINSLTDLFYALSPLYFFGGLQMSIGRKLTIIGLTGSGLIVFSLALIRASFARDFFDPDSTWALHRVYLCTIVERCLAQVIADLPAVYPHLRNISKKAVTLISTRHKSTNNGYADYQRPSSLRSPLGTLDAEGRPRPSRSPFAAYGKACQFSQITAAERNARHISDDALPLNGILGTGNGARFGHDTESSMAERGIIVKKDFKIRTEQTKQSS